MASGIQYGPGMSPPIRPLMTNARPTKPKVPGQTPGINPGTRPPPVKPDLYSVQEPGYDNGKPPVTPAPPTNTGRPNRPGPLAPKPVVDPVVALQGAFGSTPPAGDPGRGRPVGAGGGQIDPVQAPPVVDDMAMSAGRPAPPPRGGVSGGVVENPGEWDQYAGGAAQDFFNSNVGQPAPSPGLRPRSDFGTQPMPGAPLVRPPRNLQPYDPNRRLRWRDPGNR